MVTMENLTSNQKDFLIFKGHVPKRWRVIQRRKVFLLGRKTPLTWKDLNREMGEFANLYGTQELTGNFVDYLRRYFGLN